MFFNMISGDTFMVEEDEVKNLEATNIPLKKAPSKSCKKCYGRMHVGKMTRGNYYIPCPVCMRKCADFSAMKNEEIIIEAPRQTDELASDDFNNAVKLAIGDHSAEN